MDFRTKRLLIEVAIAAVHATIAALACSVVVEGRIWPGVTFAFLLGFGWASCLVPWWRTDR